jgi:lycopene cyclase CruA
MKELAYLEVPTPDISGVKDWLQNTWQPLSGNKVNTPDGIRIGFGEPKDSGNEVSIFVWQLQRTTYLKMFQWGEGNSQAKQIKQELIPAIQVAYPPTYPAPPEVDLSQQSIFAALKADYPQTVHFFQKMPNGEYDLNRVYWWEKRWRESVKHPQQPQEVIFKGNTGSSKQQDFDLIYLGGALGVIHAAVMALKGYKVLLVERLPLSLIHI